MFDKSCVHGWLICDAARFVGPPSLDQVVGRRCAGPTLQFLQSGELAGRGVVMTSIELNDSVLSPHSSTAECENYFNREGCLGPNSV